jgi:hypothetical protein
MRWTFLFSILLLSGCSDLPPAPEKVGLKLALEDVSCTEAWVRLSVPISSQGRIIDLVRDAALVSRLRLLSSDTVIIDEGLDPKHSYRYQAFRLENGRAVEVSDIVSATTVDTTSHEISWTVEYLGDGASVLWDVAIISDTLAYAVGEMYLRDSLGNWDLNAYNAARWNGAKWELKRIPFIGPCSAVDYPPIRAIWAFSEDYILVTNGGSIVRYDGRSASMDCRMNSLLVGAINKIFAVAPEDVYAVGIHYVNGSWQKLDMGTTLPVQDIWGGQTVHPPR